MSQPRRHARSLRAQDATRQAIMTLERFGFKGSAVPCAASEESGTEREESATVGPVTKKHRYNPSWTEDRPWLRYDTEQEVMYCVCCREYDRNAERNQFVKGCSSMKVESIKKHEGSRQHKDSESANRACKVPNQAPLERAFMSMEREQQNQMEILFRSVYYLVMAECPFRDFRGLMGQQEINGLSFSHTYLNDKQCRIFVEFIAEEI